MKAAIFAAGVAAGIAAILLFFNLKTNSGEAVTASPEFAAQYQAAQKQSIDMVARQAKHMELYETMLNKGIDDQNRFSKVLDTWEAQQKQYQSYLDTLPKTQ